MLRIFSLASSRYRGARKMETAVGLAAVAVLSKERTVVANRSIYLRIQLLR